MKKIIPEDLTDLVFLDLETPGLEPTDGPPLQLGLVHVRLDDGVQEVFDMARHVTDEEVTKWSRVVRDMHTETGLLERCRGVRKSVTHQDLSRAGVRWLDGVRSKIKVRKGTYEDEPLVMAGGGIDRFDRPYLKQWMPAVDRQFHYWTIDASVVERTLRSQGFAVPEDLGQHQAGLTAHLAVDDCLDSWNRYVALRKWLTECGVPRR